MFVLSMKASKLKLAAICTCLALCVTLAAAWIVSATGSEKKPDKAMLESNEAIILYLKGLGWETGEKEEEIADVTIPQTFGKVYEKYNILQKKQGFDLSPYAGKTVKRYTYAITNHPSGEQDVRANLLIYKGQLIGGDVCSVRLEGFMHGFKMPKIDKVSS